MLAIVLAAVASMVLGFLWYSPLLFSKPWMKLSGLTEKSIKENRSNMNLTYGLSTLASIIMAFVLNMLINNLNIISLYPALMIAFWVWLGFVATTMVTGVLYDRKPWMLFLINTGYQLASLFLMAVILVLV